MWNPFKKQEAEQKPQEAKPAEKKQKQSIEERLEKELDSLPAMFKSKLKDPAVKQRFIDIAKRMEQDGVDFKSIRAMKKWMEAHKAEFQNPNGEVQKFKPLYTRAPKSAVMTRALAEAAKNTKNAAAPINNLKAPG